MSVKYEATVTSVGELASAFAVEGILVFFGSEAPEELHEFAILTDHHQAPETPVEIGDRISLGDDTFPVVSVGPVANENLAELGHLVVKFNGLDEPELPGDVSLPAVDAPPIEPGLVVRIHGKAM